MDAVRASLREGGDVAIHFTDNTVADMRPFGAGHHLPEVRSPPGSLMPSRLEMKRSRKTSFRACLGLLCLTRRDILG